jgi:hypothetical protein
MGAICDCNICRIGSRSKEYQFCALELYLDQKGNGDGLMYPPQNPKWSVMNCSSKITDRLR